MLIKRRRYEKGWWPDAHTVAAKSVQMQHSARSRVVRRAAIPAIGTCWQQSSEVDCKTKKIKPWLYLCGMRPKRMGECRWKGHLGGGLVVQVKRRPQWAGEGGLSGDRALSWVA